MDQIFEYFKVWKFFAQFSHLNKNQSLEQNEEEQKENEEKNQIELRTLGDAAKNDAS